MREILARKTDATTNSGYTRLGLTACIERGVIKREQIADWLLSICEIRNFEDKVHELLKAGIMPMPKSAKSLVKSSNINCASK